MNLAGQFSQQAKAYARFRPQYPPALFRYLAGLTPERELAWDCGTGNGQAALGLAEHFARVVATDANAQQIAHAIRHPRIRYRVALAQAASLPPKAADLVTVAQAIHWFDLDRFYAEVRRVLKPGGVLAAWTYRGFDSTPEIDRLMARLNFDILGAYWAPALRHVHQGYRSLPFPFEELSAPEVTIEAAWTLQDVVGFVDSWSATQKFIAARGHHPLAGIRGELDQAWGAAETRRLLKWRLYFRIGRMAFNRVIQDIDQSSA